MKAALVVLALVAGLAVPSVASATGTHTPTTKPAPKDCACCVDLSQRIDNLELVFNQKITALEQRITQLEQNFANLQNQITNVDLRITEIINQNEALKCRSNREYNFRLRSSINGSRVTSVESVSVAGDTATQMGVNSPGGRAAWTDGTGRFRIWANYSGLVVPAGQLRTVTVVARTANGERYRLVQFVRLCLEVDGNPNDTPAQDRATDGTDAE